MQGLRRISVVVSTAAIAAAGLVVVGTASPAGAVDVGSEAAFRAAWATAPRIELTDDITLTCAGGGAANRTANANVEVFGEGHTIRMEAGCIDRVLEITSDVNTSSVKLDHVTIRGGRLPGGGSFYGAGIFMNNTGSLTIIDSTFTDNESCSDGAAIDMEGGSSAEFELEGSTIADNTSQRGYGGAAWLFEVPSTIVNSTITDNDALFATALAYPSLELQYADIVDNNLSTVTTCTIVAPGSVSDISSGDAQHADAHAGDVDAAAAPDKAQLLAFDLTSFGSVLTGDIPNCDAATLQHTDSNGYNRASDSTCRLDGKEDEQHVDDPGLGDLADNGGPTKTLLPEKDSDLLDEIPIDRCSGPDDAVDEDQRGVHRPQGDGCDIGSVEVEVGGPVVTPAVVVEPTFTG